MRPLAVNPPKIPKILSVELNYGALAARRLLVLARRLEGAPRTAGCSGDERGASFVRPRRRVAWRVSSACARSFIHVCAPTVKQGIVVDIRG